MFRAVDLAVMAPFAGDRAVCRASFVLTADGLPLRFVSLPAHLRAALQELDDDLLHSFICGAVDWYYLVYGDGPLVDEIVVLFSAFSGTRVRLELDSLVSQGTHSYSGDRTRIYPPVSVVDPDGTSSWVVY